MMTPELSACRCLLNFTLRPRASYLMTSEKAEEVIRDFGAWTVHRPAHADLLRAARLQRRYKISWWDALIVNSATELGCLILWSEDLSNGHQYGPITVRNPFL